MRVFRTIIFFFAAVFSTNGYAQPCSPNSDCKILFTSEEIEDNAVIVAMGIPITVFAVPDIPVISRLDKNGVVEWEVQGDLEGYTSLNKIRLYDLTEDYIYALLTIPETHHNSQPWSQIWKINKLSGVIEWESILYESDSESKWESIGMFEYDEDLICFYNPKRDNNGGTIDGFELYTINKITNTVELIHESNQSLKSINMLSDHQGNIITTSYQGTTDVEKFNGLDLNHRIWHYDLSQTTSATVDNIEDFIIDNKGFLYLFTNIDGFLADSLTLTKFNGMTGDLLWSMSLSTPFKWLRDKKIFQNELYVSLRHLVGTPQYGGVVKVDIDNGSILWSQYNLVFNAPGLTSSCHGAISGIRSFDVDCDGFVYATGFDQSQYHNFAPGAWGIMKLDNITGTMIESSVVTLDTVNMDRLSHGARIHVLDDSLLALGYLQSDSTNRVLTAAVGDNLISSIEYPWFSIDQQSVCDSITWIDGITYTTSNNSAIYGLPGASGCDSIIRLDLTINSTVGIDSITSCDSITWIDGNIYSTNNNSAAYVLTNVSGCDSTVTLNLTIDNYTASDTRTECAPYTWIDNNVYTASNNTATHMFTSIDGCDSLVTLDLTIQQVNTILSINDPIITANSTSGTYQWLDCDNSFSPVNGETSQSFTATINGNYALMVTENGCVDTSNCVSIVTVGIGDENMSQASFTIFPNPTRGKVNLEFSDYSGFSSIKIYNVLGQIVSETLVNKNQLSLELGEASGVYYLEIIKPASHNQMIKVIKH